MSVRTAESHHANIMAKLNVESLGDLVRFALRDGVT
jgi:FixJ family two-component response regulator